MLTNSGFAPEVIEQHMALAPAQLDVERNSYRDAPVASGRFPVVLYSHGTLAAAFYQRHDGREPGQPGLHRARPRTHRQRCARAVRRVLRERDGTPGVMPAALSSLAAFDVARNEYTGQTFDPFFLVGAAAPPAGASINPVEVALTLDRVGDYRATLAALDGALGRRGQRCRREPCRHHRVFARRHARAGRRGADR